MSSARSGVDRLVLVLGDQLDRKSPLLAGIDPARDAVWMAEVPGEAEKVWSHQARIALFLAAMRHFRDDLRRRGIRVHYRALGEEGEAADLAEALERAVGELAPRSLAMIRPGEWGVQEELRRTARKLGLPLEIEPDPHFICSDGEFAGHAEGRKQLRMETFYRWLRRRHDVLMEDGGPRGGRWNYDRENRRSFGRKGPGELPLPPSFPPDRTTREVLALVASRFGGHPGSLAGFDWPVTPAAAEEALADFIDHRLAGFGPWQDAMWTGEPFLHHSLLSPALNLKLLDPRQVVAAAVRALEEGRAPLPSVEGFVRQVLGWREFIRGVYWRHMPEYAGRNHFAATLPLPSFYWDGGTRFACIREVVGQTMAHGYSHHIQRLMVTGLFALLLGVEPREVHRWYLAVYVDAVEWVELPNTLGMSQYADGGLLASKPYAATGKYIRRMSDFCRRCPCDPERAAGKDACPFTTLYWDFLARHRRRLAGNPRMSLQLRNLERRPAAELREIAARAHHVREGCTAGSW